MFGNAAQSGDEADSPTPESDEPRHHQTDKPDQASADCDTTDKNRRKKPPESRYGTADDDIERSRGIRITGHGPGSR